jgi:hypothetical protein
MAAIRLSAKAHQLAHRPARRAGRTVADIVERGLEAYEGREVSREPALAFYTRLARDYGCDVDLEAVIRASRTAARGREFDRRETKPTSQRPVLNSLPWEF